MRAIMASNISTWRIGLAAARRQGRRIVAVGYTPTNDVADLRPKAHRKIQADFEVLPDMGLKPPCALCVKGGLDVGGSPALRYVLYGDLNW